MGAQAPIDRHALVTRHNVVLTAFDGNTPLQVGNGQFAFGMDATGLQTFAPFNTMSHWGWQTSALPPGTKVADYKEQIVDTHGRPVPYPMMDPEHPAISDWMVSNPHRINLGRVGFVLAKRDGTLARVGDLTNIHQAQDMWSGLVTSRFDVDGDPVTVITACDPTSDTIGVKVDSPLIKQGRISVFLDCPGNDGLGFANFVGDWGQPAKLAPGGDTGNKTADFVRPLDADTYHISLAWHEPATIQAPDNTAPPLTILQAAYGGGDQWLDVTKNLNDAVQNGRLSMLVGNAIAGDPRLGKPKSIRVTYLEDGQPKQVEVPENGRLEIDPHPEHRQYTLHPATTDAQFSFSCCFAPKPVKVQPDGNAVISASTRYWPTFWRNGGAIDLSGSLDPRANELERRIVLSQYLMATNEAGAYPPQESGLVNNGWFGRFHLEMYWWHAAHFALWNRWPLLDRSLDTFYSRLLPEARKRAAEEGYKGARWPKCIGPDGREWPHEIHSLLIWQQPHPIFFAELDYRAHPTKATLEKWRSVVEATADFLASYAFLDPSSGKYILGPPVVLVSENTDWKVTKNPTYELGYWRFGLRTAQEWRKRLGLAPRADWEKVLGGLAPLPVQDGRYVLYEGVQDMWTKWNFEHPALTGALGMLPGDGVDPATMRRTLDKVHDVWNFDRTWGWDFPMLAMCAARLGEPERAIEFLSTKAPGFQFDVRGLATGGPFPYFPSNGALLYAVALMAKGWTGAPNRPAPGFPNDGRWKVRYEGLVGAP